MAKEYELDLKKPAVLRKLAAQKFHLIAQYPAAINQRQILCVIWFVGQGNELHIGFVLGQVSLVLVTALAGCNNILPLIFTTP